MIIDASALVAIMLNESSANRLAAAIERSQLRLISAGTVIELSLVLLGRFGEQGEVQLDALLRGEPLLFVGDDFAKTDVMVAAW